MILHKGRMLIGGTVEELRVKSNMEGADLEELFLKLTQGADAPPVVA